MSKWFVSIHAPAWGATAYAKPNALLEQFQSTLPRGERLSISVHYLTFMKFQSTLPRGERHSIITMAKPTILFQSTLPRGERL